MTGTPERPTGPDGADGADSADGAEPTPPAPSPPSDPPAPGGGGPAGGGVVRASWAGTVAFVALAGGSLLVPGLRGVATGVSVLLFGAGSFVFLAAVAIAAGRSRTEAIGIGGLFFLAGATAPAAVRRSLMASLAVETVVAFAAAVARPFTSQAFGILVPIYGLAMAGLWGARHGSFGPRAGDG